MKSLLGTALILGLVANCSGEQLVSEFDWQKLATSGQLRSGTVRVADGRTVLEVSNTNDLPLQAQLFKIPKPSIHTMRYALLGEIKYDGVRGDGYLEMWNYFPPAKAGQAEGGYFSRTLGQSGEMGKITGTCGWRQFMLPFDRTGTPNSPSRLEINLFLPGQGKVYMGPVKLVEYSNGPSRARASAPWWSDQTGGMIGGLMGTTFGCLGGLLGFLASRGRARGFVLHTIELFIVVGIGSGLAGLFAIWSQQPFGVWSVLLILSVVLVVVSPAALSRYRRIYEDKELRRMIAADAVGS